MPTYKVRAVWTEIYEIEVEAENTEDARHAADSLVCDGNSGELLPYLQHNEWFVDDAKLKDERTTDHV